MNWRKAVHRQAARDALVQSTALRPTGSGPSKGFRSDRHRKPGTVVRPGAVAPWARALALGETARRWLRLARGSEGWWGLRSGRLARNLSPHTRGSHSYLDPNPGRRTGNPRQKRGQHPRTRVPFSAGLPDRFVPWPAENAGVAVKDQASLLTGSDIAQDVVDHLLIGLSPQLPLGIEPS